MSQPTRCASQLMPSESQKVDWSMAWVLSDGQRVLFDVELDMAEEGKGERGSGDRPRGEKRRKERIYAPVGRPVGEEASREGSRREQRWRLCAAVSTQLRVRASDCPSPSLTTRRCARAPILAPPGPGIPGVAPPVGAPALLSGPPSRSDACSFLVLPLSPHLASFISAAMNTAL